ncbi:MAG: hypothetical protein WCE63_04020 [Acidobacteriaceae bacterium]
MSLAPSSFFESDKTGNTETITLASATSGATTNALIGSAFYGKDTSGTPAAATVSADKKSVTITVLLGVNALVVTAVSPDSGLAIVQLVQGATVLSKFTIAGHSGVSTIFIQGT